MNDILFILTGLIPFFGGLEFATFVVVILIAFIAWFNRATLPVIFMAFFLLFYYFGGGHPDIPEISGVYHFLMIVVGAVSGVFLIQGALTALRRRG